MAGCRRWPPKAYQLATGASTVAMRGGKMVSPVVETMKSINDSRKKIADIITVIGGIAFHTNILALNAAVDAARAGDQGTTLVERDRRARRRSMHRRATA